MAGFYSIILCAVMFLARVLSQGHKNGNCVQFKIPVSATSASAIYDLPSVNTSIEAAAYALYHDRWTTPQGPATILQNTTTSGTFNINAQLCIPMQREENWNTLQLATHGIHYDSRYWDAQVNQGNQSYIESTLQAGYSIFTYDRLGVGRSDHPDGYDVVQAPLELEILRQLTLMARNGTLYHIARNAVAQSTSPTFNIPDQPQRIVHVGHSFGSFLTSAFLAEYPSLTDGALLTGYVLSKYIGKPGYASFALESPCDNNPPFVRPSGYLLASRFGIQNTFFGGDPEAAFTADQFEYGDSIKQPVAIGELASSFQIVGLPAPNFKGPVHFMLAEFDFFICDGNCNGAYDIQALKFTYPNASAVEAYIQPNTGHGLTLHNNATAGYQVMFEFLQRNGL